MPLCTIKPGATRLGSARMAWRIKAGYEDAIKQEIGKPKPVEETAEKIKKCMRKRG